MATVTDVAAGPQSAGLRERSKLDKRRRIVAAARQVFLEKGYDDATTREIAAVADVSSGTVFVYARDKRELLLMVVNDELEALGAKAAAAADRGGPLLERLVGYFQLRYRYWAAEPRLSRPALQITADFLGPGEDAGEQAQRFYARRQTMLAQVTDMVREAQAAGELAVEVDAARVAELLVMIYLSEVRRWLHGRQPKVAAGVERLRGTLMLAIRGVLPRPVS